MARHPLRRLRRLLDVFLTFCEDDKEFEIVQRVPTRCTLLHKVLWSECRYFVEDYVNFIP